MAYNRKNRLKLINKILEIYNDHKEYDIPDTWILENVFPKFNIYLSYRSWMNIKREFITKTNSNDKTSSNT